VPESITASPFGDPESADGDADEQALRRENDRLREQVALLEARLLKHGQQRRAMLHILADLNALNRRSSNQRKAMIHILADYEQDRRRLAAQTERAEAAQQRLAYLALASSILATSLDYSTLADQLVELIVPELADWCSLELLGEFEDTPRISFAYVDPEQGRQIERSASRLAPAHAGDWATADRDLEKPQLLAEVSPREVRDLVGNEEQYRLLDQLGSASCLRIPIRSYGRSAGVLTCVLAHTRRRYGPADLSLAEDLAYRAGQALENARLYRELEELIRMRDDFLATMSHDLKNPLTAIKGWSQLLQSRAAHHEDPEVRQLVEGFTHINATAAKMTVRIDQLLDIARVQMAGQLDLDCRTIDLVDLVRQVITEQQTTVRHRIEFEAAVTELTCVCDTDRLERVIGNLLSNAIKYSPNATPIRLSLGTDKRAGGIRAVLTVQDQGVGIPAEDVPHIFDRFHRAGNVVGSIPGTGIGLFAAQQIIQQHGGSISVESQEGTGTAFTVVLPLVPPVDSAR
jgi:signal transduction histidine kinase